MSDAYFLPLSAVNLLSGHPLFFDFTILAFKSNNINLLLCLPTVWEVGVTALFHQCGFADRVSGRVRRFERAQLFLGKY